MHIKKFLVNCLINNSFNILTTLNLKKHTKRN